MIIPRHFTQSGQSPYDVVEYERRSSVLRNPDGSVINQIADVEVPKGFSQVATDILAQKYFRRAGVPDVDPESGHQRVDEEGRPATRGEASIVEVVHRMAGCWRHWGETHGYFATADDAQAFYDELVAMLLKQMAAPNSPQWFNTGLAWAYGITGHAQGHWHVDPTTGELRQSDDAYTRPQPHACFIQSVSDDLVNDGGIMDLWTREARVFKYGSGTGSNFSALRAEGESLSGGGKSSGLMSFLKIGDRAAGAIKSGGTTRRAAKMVCLDMDHPDIERFINWKSDEEKKAKILIDAGYDSDFNGEAYQTVAGQNSNNSVRVPHDFLKAVERGKKWDTTWRTTGKVARSYQARDLWNQIADAAWRCADPGVQYDTTINDWHTCPADGRINASNPCVTGDTLVATAGGWRRIVDLVGKRTMIVNGMGEKVWIDGAFKTGTKPVFELKTRAGYSLRLTADHKVLTRNRGDVAASELRDGDILMLERPGFNGEPMPEALAETIGAAVGDGCLTVGANGQEFLFVSMGADEAALAERVNANLAECKRAMAAEGAGDGRSTRSASVVATATGLRAGTSVANVLSKAREFAVLDQGSAKKAFTRRVFDLDSKAQAAVLRGLFAADGTVANYGDKSQHVALDSVSLELLRQVQLLLLGFGVKAKIYENRRPEGQESAILPDGKGGEKAYPVQQIHSLRITRSSRVAFEKAIGFPAESPKAAKLAEMNRDVKAYRDLMEDEFASLTPAGVEDVYDLTEPISHHFVAAGIVVHNCSEYMFLDDTACNLASINLLQFYDADRREFDVAGFEHACRLWTIVLEISVLMAQFPSREIAWKSYAYRTLGLGYANLGALLMTAGIPYDSEEGRAWAGAITALMTGVSYKTSAEMAGELGPFPAYERNRESMLRVIRNHRRAAFDTTPPVEFEGLSVLPLKIDGKLVPKRLLAHARKAWDDALTLGERSGYRNAQATVIAPTGTIGLLMDCVAGDTRVITEMGEYAIEELADYAVTGGVQVLKVLSVDAETGETSWQPLDMAWVKPALRELVEIETEDGRTLRCTPDHRVLTTNGFKAAKDLTEEDEIVEAEGIGAAKYGKAGKRMVV